MSSAVVDSIGHLAIRTRDLDAAMQHAVETMGMRETLRDGDTSYLRVGDSHHWLQYVAADEDGLDHLGLLAAGEAGLAEARSRVAEAGLQVVSERPLDPGLADGFAFVGPDDVT